jgi:hypothetical protein|tara:strand:- start:2073 stop:2678 length:606 start_codon:yes stop_codon:yes gene_type:complete
MGIMATTTDGNMAYPQVPAGVHKSRCVKIIDLGTQRQEFSGEVSWKRQVMLIWEIPEQDNMNGEPMTISKFYTLSLHEKSNLGADLTSWRGRAFTETEKQGFDISNLASVTCMLNVLEGKNGKSKISGIMPLPKGDEVAPQYNDTIVFSVDEYQQGNKEPFNQLSEGIRRMILRCKELEDINTDTGDENNGVDLGSDDVPF